MRPPLFLAAVLALLFAGRAAAHPTPDVPVQASFDAMGAGVVRVEFDLRLIDAEPDTAPYFKNEFLADKPAEWRTATIEKARAFVSANVEFHFEPGGRATPEWQWEFTGQKGVALAAPDDPVMLTGTWRVAPGPKTYRLRSTPTNKWSVLFLNTLRGKELERTQVLFPGETSFALELTPPTGAALQPREKAVALPWWRRLLGA